MTSPEFPLAKEVKAVIEDSFGDVELDIPCEDKPISIVAKKAEVTSYTEEFGILL